MSEQVQNTFRVEIENTFRGDAKNNKLKGKKTSDLLFGDLGIDTLTGGAGDDFFAYAGDPFEGEDVSDPERQIIAEEDWITDFEFTKDRYLLDARDFDIVGDVKFAAVDSQSADAEIASGTNVVTLLNSDNDNDPKTPFLAGTAANEIAELATEDGAGLFVYYNSDLELNRLVYSTNLNDADADLKVISRQTDLTGSKAVAALEDFSADNFEFTNIQIFGDEDENRLVGTAAREIFFSDLGSDTITGGTGADAFAYAGDPFEGEDVSDPERQIIAEEDFITDFGFIQDRYLLDADDFDITGDVKFAAVNSQSANASIAPGTNVVTLLNSDNDNNPNTPFLAGTAANEIAELATEDGAGLFVYYNSDLELNRLVYSTNLNDADADLKIIARQINLTGSKAVAALEDFSADNFEFEGLESDMLASDAGADFFI